jgi:hypothetical protein
VQANIKNKFLIKTDYFFETHQGQRLNKKIDLQHLPAGTYFLTVQMESGSFVRRVVKR